MLVGLTVRRLKDGTFEDFAEAWKSEEQPAGWKASYTVRNVADENEIISFGFFDGTLEELRQSQQDFGYDEQRGRIDEVVESTGTDGIYEVVIQEGEGP